VNDEDLRELLQTADAANPPPVVQVDAKRIRSREQRRRIGRTFAATFSIALVVFIASVAWHARFRPVHPQIAQQSKPIDPTAIRARIALLDQEAKDGERLANLMLADEARTARRGRLHQTDFAVGANVELEAQRDQTARLLIDRADWLTGRPGAATAAADEYRRVIELFPASPLARTARDRLDQLKL
jgi:hypothetical protein